MMIIEGRGPNMRHVLHNTRVELDWLFGRPNLFPTNSSRCVNTKEQMTDSLTKGLFTFSQWTHVIQLIHLTQINLSKGISNVCFLVLQSALLSEVVSAMPPSKRDLSWSTVVSTLSLVLAWRCFLALQSGEQPRCSTFRIAILTSQPGGAMPLRTLEKHVQHLMRILY